MKEPLLSIITVVLNNKTTIERTIKSVIEQEYSNLEYIIIDGGSTDGTLDIINNYSKHIDKLISEKDDGIYDAMNKGIELAEGELIGIINSDDWYSKGAFSNVMGKFRETNADVIYGDMYKVNHETGDKKLYSGNIKRGKASKIQLNHPTIFIKRKIYKKYGKFDSSLIVGADRDLILRLLNSSIKFKKVKSVIAYFSLGGITSQRNYSLNRRRMKDKYKLLTRNNVNFIDKWIILTKDFIRLNRDILIQ